MLEPGLPNLFEALGIARPTAHSKQVLRDDWMIVVWKLEPIQIFDAGIARRCRHAKSNKTAAASALRDSGQVSDDDVWSRIGPGRGLNHRRHDCRLNGSVGYSRDFDRSHYRSDRNDSSD